MAVLKDILKRLLAVAGYRVAGTRYTPWQLLEPTLLRLLEFDDVLCRRMVEVGRPLQFIQVGAFDGVTADPLEKYIAGQGWRGVLVEPQARAAAQLRARYAHCAGVAVMQAAVDRTPGQRTLYVVSGADAPAWAGGLASFDREVILKHADQVPDLAGMIREETVACVTFDEVLDKLAAPDLDLLQIDTEGADATILALFPFGRITPAIVHWEVKHMTRSERESCLDRLAGFGFRFALSGGEDMLAVRF